MHVLSVAAATPWTQPRPHSLPVCVMLCFSDPTVQRTELQLAAGGSCPGCHLLKRAPEFIAAQRTRCCTGSSSHIKLQISIRIDTCAACSVGSLPDRSFVSAFSRFVTPTQQSAQREAEPPLGFISFACFPALCSVRCPSEARQHANFLT